MPELLCICSSDKCVHQPGERCGNPINENNAHPAVMTDPGEFKGTGGWICDECWDRVKPV